MKKEKMKLHVFNPEHDIALAHNDKFFTAPKVARRLRSACGFIPALWADEGDFVLVDDAERAENSLAETGIAVRGINFITSSKLNQLPDEVEVEPWGWDSALCFQLRKAGLKSHSIPSDDQLNTIRELSSRQFASEVLKELLAEADSDSIFTIGKSDYITDVEQFKTLVEEYKRAVLKEPWSCSGRGVRYVMEDTERKSRSKFEPLDEPTINWVKNIIQRQGGIMVEPYYNNVFDFGMEFQSDSRGVHFLGLSVFGTSSGFYIGNLVASEATKEQLVSSFLPLENVNKVKLIIERLLGEKLRSKYTGPLGVDMMVVRTAEGALRLHPMVEINMRRTMGHVAIDVYGKLPFDKAVIALSAGNNSEQSHPLVIGEWQKHGSYGA